MGARTDRPAERDDAYLTALLDAGYRYAMALCHDASLASDLVQDAWVSVLRAGQARPARSYFYRAVHSRFIDHCRRSPRLVPTREDVERLLPDAAEGLTEDEERRRRVHAALALLRPEEREAILLTVVDGLTAREAGSLLGKPRGTILSLLKRGKDHLRRTLQSWRREVG